MPFQIRLMTPADISAGMRLKDIAGWNQTKEDWQHFLHLNPGGCFVTEWLGQVVGTVTTIIYEDCLAWVGMVLVDPRFRGKGIGTALLLKAIGYLDAKGVPCVKLDATPQGKPIYAGIGFQAEREIERWVLTRQAGTGLVCNDAEDVESVLATDREVFGADRSALLRLIAGAAPELLIVKRQGHTLVGYALGRRGSQADHVGPWVARNAPAARAVLEDFLLRSRREVIFVDVVKDSPWAPSLLLAQGFRFSRSLTRMYRGENARGGRPDLLCAILGPEFG